ncbi:hypothetical protein DPM19_26805 [Actinomadura craniellae]|uniref:DUF6285 domain-containing protein n=1 Tax=Actinomadura craniellae TaxID=2231787 RepID=A0A365GYQ0_9ACTN|nr:DUF6285 domain-containing protein [Actinomadura craniellae]RAY11965.1 hypothetical protein DPM19_26805 [Actinomadura craniellae]
MTGLHGRPTLDELLEAVQEFLTEVIAPVTPAEHAYHLRVAVNVLAVARREAALGTEQEAEHTARLAALGFADDRELAAALRAGTVPPEAETGVREAVFADVLARLAVANPAYPAQEDRK